MQPLSTQAASTQPPVQQQSCPQKPLIQKVLVQADLLYDPVADGQRPYAFVGDTKVDLWRYQDHVLDMDMIRMRLAPLSK